MDKPDLRLNSTLDSSEYMQLALRTDSTPVEYADRAAQMSWSTFRLVHASMGISGEAGELIDTIKKTVFYGKEPDYENLVEEAGDLLWYVAILLDACGVTFSDAMLANIEKLRKRFPDGFDAVKAIERNVAAEQAAVASLREELQVDHSCDDE